MVSFYPDLVVGKATVPEIIKALDEYVSIGAAISPQYVIELLTHAPTPPNEAERQEIASICQKAYESGSDKPGEPDKTVQEYLEVKNWAERR